MPHHTLTLFELNSLVRNVLESSFDSAYWVEAELSEAREVRGHCYLELIQKDIFSATPIARASAKCWKTVWKSLRPRFERITGLSLHAGMKVLLLVTANFHEAYGFSWIVQDIDPTYTMGDMARKRLEIIAQLKAQGIFDMQKELEFPMFAQRIAVISSANAAGYDDFCNQLEHNEYGFKFYLQLFPAVMQGEQVEQSIIAALNRIHRNIGSYDAAVIIRGGGATADLSGFDTLALAENVANFPIPIITGIGHERNESIIDMVAHTRVKTPTAAAAFLIERLANVWTHVNRCQSRMVTHVKLHMEREQMRLNHYAEHIPTLFSMTKVRQEAHLDRLTTQMLALVDNRLSHCHHRLRLLQAELYPLAERLVRCQDNRLEQLGTRLRTLDPRLLLKRGYSITLHNGKAVRNASQLRKGDEIKTLLEKGDIKSIIK